MECFGTTDFDNNSRLITLSEIIISGLHCINVWYVTTWQFVDIKWMTKIRLKILGGKKKLVVKRRNRFYGNINMYLYLAQQLPVGRGLLTHEASRAHTTPHQSVWLLWTSDQLDAETSTWQHTTLTTERHPCPPRDSNP